MITIISLIGGVLVGVLLSTLLDLVFLKNNQTVRLKTFWLLWRLMSDSEKQKITNIVCVSERLRNEYIVDFGEE